MWTACWSGNIIVNNEDPKHVFLEVQDKELSYFGTSYSNSSYLLLRDEYIRIWNKLHEPTNIKSIVVEGTKGIGKTLFMSWLVYHIVEEEKKLHGSSSMIHDGSSSSNTAASSVSCVKEYHRPVILLGWNTDPRSYFVLFHNQSDIPTVKAYSSVNDVLNNGFTSIDYYLSDEKTTQVVPVKRWQLSLFSLGNPDKARSVIQTATDPTFDIILMDVLTIDELVALAVKKNFDQNDGKFIYTVFGGSARMLSLFISIKNKKDKSELFVKNDALLYNRLLTEFFGDTDFADCGELIQDAANVFAFLQQCTRGQRMEVSAMAEMSSLFVHWTMNAQFRFQRFASTFMKYLASWIEDNQTDTVFGELKKIVNASGIGFAFEREVIKMFLSDRNNREFEMTKLNPKRSTIVDAVKRELFQFTRKVFIYSIDDIKNLQEHELGVPAIPNFPLVDFILKPSIYFQVTIQKNKHKGAVHLLGDLNEIMSQTNGRRRTRTKPKMVFVLSKENYDDFKYNEDLKNIEQYKMLAGFSASRTRPRCDDEEVEQPEPKSAKTGHVRNASKLLDPKVSPSHGLIHYL